MRGVCSIMHGLAAGSSAERKKTSAEKRKNHSVCSKWRRCTGEAKVPRTQAWRATSDQTSWRYWVRLFQYRNLHAVAMCNAVRKFIIELWQKSLSSPVGPPTAEYWMSDYSEDDNVTVRQLNKVIHEVAPNLEEDLDSPYVRSRLCNSGEWIKLYSDGDELGHYDAFDPWWVHFHSLDHCPWLQRRHVLLQGPFGLGFGRRAISVSYMSVRCCVAQV